VEFLNSSNLEILNQENEPTFCSGGMLEVRAPRKHYRLGGFIRTLPVGSVTFILFILRGSVPVRLIRNPRGTKWGSFKGDLRDRLERGPEMNTKNEAGLWLAIHWVQQALISVYEDNCPL